MAVTEVVPLHETDIDSVVCVATPATASVVRTLGRDRHRQRCVLQNVAVTEVVPLHETDMDSVVCVATTGTAGVVRTLG